MTLHQDTIQPLHRHGIPRGLLDTGPILLSYGFRPFFLGGAIWAVIAMVLWILALSGNLEVAGGYGMRAWHAHEMLFGFGSAIVAGFLLTAVPNWTGRLPVSGPPLLRLALLWLAGRIALLLASHIGLWPAVSIDSLFLPALLAICLREIIAGRKWADLKVIGGLVALSAANVCFHLETIVNGAADISPRLAAAAYTTMIVVVGGRMLPSFTRNWIAKSGRTDFPMPYNRFDLATIILSLPALVSWVLAPDSHLTAALAVLAAVLHALRLYRWRGWTTLSEPLVAVLHMAYGFVPLGLLAIAASAVDVIDPVSALHMLSVGTVSSMMLAVMTRATRGHTGRALHASATTCLSCGCLIACALIRPLTGFLPEAIAVIYPLAGGLWIASFSLFLFEYAPTLVARKRQSRAN